MKNRALKNIAFSLTAQIVSMFSGLIVPRLILQSFGSEVNGLITSLTQLLGYISLLEGGLGSVVLAALYKPLADNDNRRLNGILNAAADFFRRLAVIFAIYCIVIGIGYPLVVKTSFSVGYISSMTLILSIGSFTQYYFAICYKLLIQADQKIYFVYFVQICTTIINFIVTCLVVVVYPDIHVLKLSNAVVFVIQSVVYSRYVHGQYQIDETVACDEHTLSQRWACFGQNIAYFVHNNTDVVVLTLFLDLKYVSVYSLHILVVEKIKSLIMSVSNAFTPMIGRALAENNREKINDYVDIFEFIMFNVSTIVFGCCLCLLTPFLSLYTSGIHDAQYYQPAFAAVIVFAEYVYCVRESYIAVVYSAGRFKETAVSAYVEAAGNISLSLLLVIKYGLLGVAVGTLFSMVYRMLYQVIYLQKHIIYRNVYKFVKRLLISFMIFGLGLFFLHLAGAARSENALSWMKNGFLGFCLFLLADIMVNWVFDRNMFIRLCKIAGGLISKKK